MSDTPALRDPRLESLPHEVIRHGPVSSLEEAAKARGVKPSQVIKTIVVRRGADDFVFVLVPGDRVIAWPKLRAHLGVNRLSMPDADEAFIVTGYARGTITPLGAKTAWPVLADQRVQGQVSIGGGDHGVSLTVSSADLIDALTAEVADVTDPV
ncbi:MAG TPA: YbaK/EbsC family protein [Acidimicrobiia bacterium]